MHCFWIFKATPPHPWVSGIYWLCSQGCSTGHTFFLPDFCSLTVFLLPNSCFSCQMGSLAEAEMEAGQEKERDMQKGWQPSGKAALLRVGGVLRTVTLCTIVSIPWITWVVLQPPDGSCCPTCALPALPTSHIACVTPCWRLPRLCSRFVPSIKPRMKLPLTKVKWLWQVTGQSGGIGS